MSEKILNELIEYISKYVRDVLELRRDFLNERLTDLKEYEILEYYRNDSKYFVEDINWGVKSCRKFFDPVASAFVLYLNEVDLDEYVKFVNKIVIDYIDFFDGKVYFEDFLLYVLTYYSSDRTGKYSPIYHKKLEFEVVDENGDDYFVCYEDDRRLYSKKFNNDKNNLLNREEIIQFRKIFDCLFPLKARLLIDYSRDEEENEILNINNEYCLKCNSLDDEVEVIFDNRKDKRYYMPDKVFFGNENGKCVIHNVDSSLKEKITLKEWIIFLFGENEIIKSLGYYTNDEVEYYFSFYKKYIKNKEKIDKCSVVASEKIVELYLMYVLKDYKHNIDIDELKMDINKYIKKVLIKKDDCFICGFNYLSGYSCLTNRNLDESVDLILFKKASDFFKCYPAYYNATLEKVIPYTLIIDPDNGVEVCYKALPDDFYNMTKEIREKGNSGITDRELFIDIYFEYIENKDKIDSNINKCIDSILKRYPKLKIFDEVDRRIMFNQILSKLLIDKEILIDLYDVRWLIQDAVYEKMHTYRVDSLICNKGLVVRLDYDGVTDYEFDVDYPINILDGSINDKCNYFGKVNEAVRKIFGSLGISDEEKARKIRGVIFKRLLTSGEILIDLDSDKEISEILELDECTYLYIKINAENVECYRDELLASFTNMVDNLSINSLQKIITLGNCFNDPLYRERINNLPLDVKESIVEKTCFDVLKSIGELLENSGKELGDAAYTLEGIFSPNEDKKNRFNR